MKLYFIESDESYAFFGVLHIFSNFHWGPFEVKGVTFFMSEQYITTELARFAKDDEAYTSGAHYMNTNTRSCPPAFPKCTVSLSS